jgi:hypothetical protein
VNDRDFRTLARLLKEEVLPAKTQWLIVSAVWLIALAVVAFTGLVAFMPHAHAGEDITIKLGRFSSSGARVEQQITIINNTAETLRFVFINCGFFRAGELVDTGTGMVTNVLPNTEGYTSASSYKAPENVKCRIESVH